MDRISKVEALGARHVAAIVDACVSHDPNMPAKTVAAMVRRRLTLGEVSAELQHIPVTAVEGPEGVIVSQAAPGLVSRMAQRFGVTVGTGVEDAQ